METETFTKGEMAIMGRFGDIKTIWDSRNPDEVANAREQFDKLKAKKFVPFSVSKDGSKGEQIVGDFDPKIERIIFVPPMAGG
jgi:hypothetical protein